MMDALRAADGRRLAALAAMRERWRALPKPMRFAVVVALVALLYGLPNLNIPLIRTPDTDFTSVLFLVAIYVLVAVGLNVVIGLAGLLDLGYIGFYAVGAYTVAIFASPSSVVATKLPWLACIPLAIGIAMLSGVILGWPTLRLRGDYLAIVTLGFGEIVRLIAVNWDVPNGQRGISGIPGPPGTWADGSPLFGLIDVRPFYWLALTVVIVCMLAVGRLEHSRVGRSWLAIREDEDAAEVMGVNTFKFKLWAFAIGAALGGLSGALFASKQAFINSDSFDLLTSILFVAAVVLGGSGNMAGVTVGAILISYLPERFRGFADYRLLVFGIALVAIMVFRPQGLIPSRRRAVELKDKREEAVVV
ncbi:branched-chain amino acid ABC transporter permease [Catenuloplanes indicus]|uniref:Branched-chain amino acid transport system permease protein n=1 Tax=Catenuloplanes indicus TaxID=137267 RepID=A0AAE3W620_9ACTN|nr:branched-chain amino acid ABC transporter permease [Catenuloplanes indicus]MDQ0369942.1 branched-chain amino acid transport system permease protein [Catenuloplanes indicus]